jgi:6-phosphogluconolactonase (cycloisomerase 2 family)
VRSGAINENAQMTSTFRNGRFIAARTAAFAALLILAACGGGGGSGPTYTIGGSISGLAGSGLELTAGAGNTVSVSKAGPFTFPTLLGAGASYDVTVASPPANPSQTCTVSNGAGTVSGAVDNITVVCVVSQFTVGGSISGLLGTGLILRDNSGDDLPVGSSGAFVFKDSVASGGAYDVTIVSQPSGPIQNCVLLAGSAAGTVSNANITDVSVVCPSAGRFAYVIDEQGSQIFGFTIDGSSGALAPMPSSPFAAPTFPGSLAADPSSRFLYVTSAGASGVIGTILAYSINQSTGALTAIPGYQFPLTDAGGIVSPEALTIDPSGKFLYAAIEQPATSPNSPNLAVAAFTINRTDGTLTPVSGSPFAIGATTDGGTPIVIGPSGQFLYIAYYDFANSTSDVTGFSVDSTTGALTMVPGGPVRVVTPAGTAAIDPRGKFLYLGSQDCETQEECGVLSTLAIDAISGALTVTGGTSEVAYNVAFNPSGNLAFGVFVQAVTAYSADPTSGALTALAGGLNFSGVFDIGGPVVVDASGNFAYLPTMGTGGSILILKIDPSTGALSLLPGSPVAVPGAILLTELIDVP